MPLLAPLLVLATFSATFERKVIEHYSQEITRGTVYYQAPGKVVVEVTDPVNQVMVVKDNSMIIYYPNDRKAFRIKTEHSIPLPFIQGIISMMQEDYGLTGQGFMLVRHEVIRDTLYTSWDPPGKNKKFLGGFILGKIEEKIVYAEAKTPTGKIAAKSFYHDHIRWGGKFIPLKVLSEVYNPSGSLQQQETVIYSNVNFNPVIPDHIVNFKIPDTIPLKEIKW